MKSALGVEWTSFMHADWPAIQGIGKAKNCTHADTHTRQVRPPREHAGPWPERACLTRPNSPGSRDPTPTGSHLGHHARTPGETHLLSCAAAHDQHDGEAELKRILRDLGPHRGEALRDRARLPNRHPGSSVGLPAQSPLSPLRSSGNPWWVARATPEKSKEHPKLRILPFPKKW